MGLPRPPIPAGDDPLTELKGDVRTTLGTKKRKALRTSERLSNAVAQTRTMGRFLELKLQAQLQRTRVAGEGLIRLVENPSVRL